MTVPYPVPFPPTRTVLRVAPGESPQAWSDALDTDWRSSATLLKRDTLTSVWRTTLLGRDVVIKAWTLATPGARLKSLLHLSRGQRHWRGAARLAAHGFTTAAPLLLGRERQGSDPVELLVMRALPGRTLLHSLADARLTTRQEHAVAAAIGRQLARLGSVRLGNRDHKPSNLILTGEETDSPEIAIIDTVAIRRAVRPCLVRMLHALAVEPLGVGLLPRRALRMRVLAALVVETDEKYAVEDVRRKNRRRAIHRIVMRRLWRQTVASVQRHGDPTPRVDPLH